MNQTDNASSGAPRLSNRRLPGRPGRARERVLRRARRSALYRKALGIFREWFPADPDHVPGSDDPAVARWMAAIQRTAWALLLMALPVTSFPYFPPAMGGEALVRPLSLYPLAILMLLAILPLALRRPSPRTLLVLLPFVLIAAASSLLSLLRGIAPALGVTASARVLRGMFTLWIGCSFYLTIALLPQNREDLRFSLRWIYAGMAAAMAWGSIQAFQLLTANQPLLTLIAKVQRRVSIRKLNPERIVGLTYEPHWFAEQIILLVIPWSLAAVLSGRSVFSWRWKWVSIELLLLTWALLVLPFTYSRSGLVDLIILMIVSLVLFARPAALADREPAQMQPGTARGLRQDSVRRLRRLVLALPFMAVALAAVLAPAYLIGTRNAFFARLWEYWQHPGQAAADRSGDRSLANYLSYLGLDARLVFAQTAYKTYQNYPLLGVGLGNYAFYFEEMLPYRSIGEIPEVMNMITPEVGRDRLITAKNLYLRILAETGIVGAAAFAAFIIANIGCALLLWKSPDPEWRYWGMASLCGLIAFSLSAMTFDSFVIPNMWVIFGLVSAAAHTYLRTYDRSHCS